MIKEYALTRVASGTAHSSDLDALLMKPTLGINSRYDEAVLKWAWRGASYYLFATFGGREHMFDLWETIAFDYMDPALRDLGKSLGETMLSGADAIIDVAARFIL